MAKRYMKKNILLAALVLSALTLNQTYAAAKTTTVAKQATRAKTVATTQAAARQVVPFSMESPKVIPASVDLNLEKAVHMALVNNSSVKISAAELNAAKALKDQALGARWGDITLSHDIAQGGYYNPDVSYGQYGPHSTYGTQVTLSFPLYTGGQLEGAIEKARKNYLSYRYALEGSYQSAKLNATTGYYDVLQASNTVTLCKETVDRLADHLKNAQAQFDVGVVAKIDVLRSQVELASAQQSLTKAENAYDLAISNLDNVIGLPLSTKLNLNEGLEYKPYNNTMDNCLTYAMANRPAVHQAEAAVDMAKAAQKIANAGNLPTVGIGATQAWAGSGLRDNDWPGLKNDNWKVGVSVSMNIWDYGVTAAKVAEAKANVIKAQETYRQTTDGVQLSVRNYYLSLREAEKRISTSSVAVAQAEEDYKIAQIRYQAGVGTNTDVIDASVSLTNAKNNYIQALYDYNTSRAELEQAMGVPVLTD